MTNILDHLDELEMQCLLEWQAKLVRELQEVKELLAAKGVKQP